MIPLFELCKIIYYCHLIFACKYSRSFFTALIGFTSFILIIKEDLDLKIGKIRIKNGGSSAGHNGLKSIDEYIGKSYNRIRIGIGHPGEKRLVEKYVLSDFKKEEWSSLSLINQNISKNINLLINKKHSSFLNKVKLS